MTWWNGNLSGLVAVNRFILNDVLTTNYYYQYKCVKLPCRAAPWMDKAVNLKDNLVVPQNDKLAWRDREYREPKSINSVEHCHDETSASIKSPVRLRTTTCLPSQLTSNLYLTITISNPSSMTKTFSSTELYLYTQYKSARREGGYLPEAGISFASQVSCPDAWQGRIWLCLCPKLGRNISTTYRRPEGSTGVLEKCF